jgi:hypothetical protein
MTAAAHRIDLEELKRQPFRRQEWQARTWAAFDEVGEVKYALSFLGNAVGKLRLFAAERAEPDAEPEPSENVAAKQALARLHSEAGGHTEILREAAINLSAPGECFLVRTELPDGSESFDIRSTDELVLTGNKYELKEPGQMSPTVLPEDSFVLRIWVRHPRWSSQPDSSLRGVLNIVDELLLLDRAARAILRSRIAGAGILKVPTSLSFGPLDPSRTDDEASDPFIEDLMLAMTTPIRDEGSASAVVPMVIRGATEDLAGLEHMALDRPLDTALGDWYERTIRRLAQGLNVPPEVILGVAGISHWGAWQIEESTFKAHIEPLAVLILEALTVGYFRPVLRDMGVADVERFVIWYDPSNLVGRPNTEQDAKDAHAAFVISDEALRRELNYPESDAPLPDEIARRCQIASCSKPTPTGAVPTIERQPPVQAVTAAAFRDLGARLAEIDRALFERLLVAASAALKRVLERAGNRTRSKVRGDRAIAASLEGVSADAVIAQLGPVLLAANGLEAEILIEGAFEDLEPLFRKWVAAAQIQALRAVGGGLVDDVALVTTRAANLDGAWRWLADAFTSFAARRLFDPAADASPFGEADDTLGMPPNIVREALARAGGSQVTQGVGGSLVSVTGGPVGGVASGQLVMDQIVERGLRPGGYVWEYGPAMRTRSFEPHLALDGVEFTSFDDPVLANPGSFPAVSHFLPGDHAGCLCNYRRLID